MNIPNGAVGFERPLPSRRADLSRASRGIRGAALQKIAALTATAPESRSTHSDLDRLCHAYHASKSPASAPLIGGSKALSTAPQSPMVRIHIRLGHSLC